ncbi:aspartyl-tRNA(Asn)/glutamyl-tRNA(Gln) amidotransferase subunit A [Kitasatospora sp. GAS204A]|uniref:amidase n=1 Tax=unclassified Kitasatospora TaxID=2633591 RepID=UPI0024763D35|nr:amidase [Kitasatospora sp. GAS204B]MDH6120147.1 aspartyl-tRNA(Asn)/glutamyl-tRNA(Gln) amidotransferase subunit A [Kitasatospora sp. GAS204B]
MSELDTAGPGALAELSVARAGALLRTGAISSVQLVEHALGLIEAYDQELHSFVLVTRDLALRRARQADRELREGVDRGPLHGIPYALKDVFAAEGLPTTNQSWLTLSDVAAQDSAVEARLRAGGGVLLGKLATYEFALGGPSADLPFPPARNPWNGEHIPSGSSSGAGVAVAAGFLRVAFGSDTAGSMRGPAFHCGTVALKPTYGAVSGHGATPLSHTMDHFGPLGWTVADTAAAFQVVAGPDPRDPRTRDAPVPDVRSGLTGLTGDVRGLRVAYSTAWYGADPATLPEITEAIERALAHLEKLGAIVEECELPPYEVFNACGRIILAAEGFAVHEANLRAAPREFGRFTYQKLMPGAGVGASDLLRALEVRRGLAAALDRRVFADHDVLITACGQTTAARFDDFPVNWPPPRLANDMQTIPFALTGHPAMSLPLGFAGNGLPIGLQLVGPRFGEASLFRAGTALEAEFGRRDTRPALTASQE